MYPADYAEFPARSTPIRTPRKWNLWGYIDARDGAQAVRRALEHGDHRRRRLHHRQRRHGHVASRTTSCSPRCFPDVPVRTAFGPNETLLSIDKARRVLGYEPQFSWRNEVG